MIAAIIRRFGVDLMSGPVSVSGGFQTFKSLAEEVRFVFEARWNSEHVAISRIEGSIYKSRGWCASVLTQIPNPKVWIRVAD